MGSVASASRKCYGALVHGHPGFLQFFRDVTPIDVIERIADRRPRGVPGRRGCRRRPAVPWVYAWMQSRHVLPGWFGIGTGLEAAAREHGVEAIEKALGDWNFLGTCSRTSSSTSVRADLDIAAHYESLATGEAPAIAAEIRREHALAQQWVTKVLEQGEPPRQPSRTAARRDAARAVRRPDAPDAGGPPAPLAGGRARDPAPLRCAARERLGIALALQATG